MKEIEPENVEDTQTEIDILEQAETEPENV